MPGRVWSWRTAPIDLPHPLYRTEHAALTPGDHAVRPVRRRYYRTEWAILCGNFSLLHCPCSSLLMGGGSSVPVVVDPAVLDDYAAFPAGQDRDWLGRANSFTI